MRCSVTVCQGAEYRVMVFFGLLQLSIEQLHRNCFWIIGTFSTQLLSRWVFYILRHAHVILHTSVFVSQFIVPIAWFVWVHCHVCSCWKVGIWAAAAMWGGYLRQLFALWNRVLAHCGVFLWLSAMAPQIGFRKVQIGFWQPNIIAVMLVFQHLPLVKQPSDFQSALLWALPIATIFPFVH